MNTKKEINNLENQNPYEGIDEKLVKFTKAIEFYDDFGKHLLCTENCKECNLQPLCEYRGEQNVNLALHLMDAGYGNVKQAIKEFIKRVNDELENSVMESSSKFNDGYNDCIFDTRCLLDNLFKELYGVDD